MGVTIDSIQIEIQSGSTNAAKGIDALASSLEKLKKNGSFKTVSTNLSHLSDALQKLPNVHQTSNALRTLANSIERLKGVGSVASIANSLKKLPEALKAVEKINLDRVSPQIRAIADAVAPLSAVKAGGLNTMVNALKNLDKVTEGLDDDTIGAFVKKVELLTSKLSPLSEKMSTIKSGFSAINSNARSAASGVEEFSDGVDASALNLSSFIEIARTAIEMLTAFVQKFTEFVAEAIEWDGIASRFGRGFGDQAQEVHSWIQRLNEEMGINVQQFMKYSSIYANMLQGFGVANEDATTMALGYTELTYDIWAGYNDIYSDFDEASDAIKSAIAGEVEPIRRAGFTIVETTLEQTAANHGLEISLYNATEAQKSYLRYLTLVDQAHAQGLVGTYAKELNTAEGMMRTFAQQLKSLTQAFASLFLPILVKVMPYLQAFVELLTEGVHWLAAFLGIELQKVDFSGYEAGAGALDNVANSAGGATDALDSATKAAKELKNATLGIDELNVISPPSATAGGGAGSGGSGSGGGGFADLDIGSLWDETIFDDIQTDVDAIKEKMRDWLPLIGSVGAALAGLRLLNLLNDLKAIEAFKGLKGIGKSLSGIKEFFAAAKQNAPEVGWFAALLPKFSTWLAGLPAALTSASGALGAAGPWIALVAVIVGGIILAFVEYDFTEVGYTLGEKIGEGIRNVASWIGDKIADAFRWLKDALDIDSVWDFILVIFLPGEFWRRISPEIGDLFDEISKWFNDKIENLKGNINEFFGGFFDGLFDGLGWDMSWADKFAEIFDIKYLDIVEANVNPTSIGKHIMTGINKGIDSNEKLSTIKDKLSSMWDTAKTWWDTQKSKLASYTPSIGNIASKLSSAWESAKTWWKDKRSSLSYTPTIGKIWEKLKSAWTSAKDWWNKSRSSLSYTPSIGSISSKLSSAWTAAKNWWNKSRSSLSYTPSIGSIKDKIVSAWNTAKKWWSSNAKLSTKLNISVPKLTVNWGEVSALGKTFKYPKSFSVKFAADGGIFDKGSLIWAGERGPEVMATAAGGKTGVMNVQQMQDAVYEGVYAAMSAALRGSDGGRGSQAVNIYLDGRQITAAVEQHQRERGASLFGNEVYSY